MKLDPEALIGYLSLKNVALLMCEWRFQALEYSIKSRRVTGLDNWVGSENVEFWRRRGQRWWDQARCVYERVNCEREGHWGDWRTRLEPLWIQRRLVSGKTRQAGWLGARGQGDASGCLV